jgi:hypothetical protein
MAGLLLKFKGILKFFCVGGGETAADATPTDGRHVPNIGRSNLAWSLDMLRKGSLARPALLTVILWVAASGIKAYAGCPTTAPGIAFEIVSEKIGGVVSQPPPVGKLEMWNTGVYRYADTKPPGECGSFDFRDNVFTFQSGPLEYWNQPETGKEGRSLTFKFTNNDYREVEIVMQESLGCSPWPSCE